MEIGRDKYLQKLVSSQDNGLVKIVTGLRRVRKSYLLFKIFKDYLLANGVTDDHIIEVSFESIEAEALREPHTLYEYILTRSKGPGKYYVLRRDVPVKIYNLFSGT